MVPIINANNYEIHVRGRIPPSWEDAFHGMAISVQLINGELVTILCGDVTDQASLQGILQNFYSLGLDLLYLQRRSNS
jgi:hypothetical protein